jgi:hypothetical protein
MIAPPPASVIESLQLYVKERVPPGDFLYAVLTNDLRESFGRADEDNRAAMFEIVSYCYNRIPANCWGSRERVQAWLRPELAAPKAEESVDGPTSAEADEILGRKHYSEH